ncbi:MAG: helix-turn-helix domain-containing protein [Rhodococcus sp. (in: high G+C Gram-positive bacteria)]|uniref:PucR family transcriptional regulator n=1 Tax=Rhodococcus sp. TaxID=1831 RepID=UPI003BB55E77
MLATVGELVDRAGLRSLTPAALQQARSSTVTAVVEFDPAGPVGLTRNGLVHISSSVWTNHRSPESLPVELKSAGAVGAVVDNDDFDMPPAFVAECVRVSLPVLVLPTGVAASTLRERLSPRVGESVAVSDVTGIRELIDGFVGSGSVRGWIVLPGCVINGTSAGEVPGTVLAQPAVLPDRIPAAAAAIHVRLPSTRRSLILTDPARGQWDTRRVVQLAEQIDARIYALDTMRAARRPAEHALIRELIQAAVPSAALGPWANSLGLESGSRIRALAVVLPDTAPVSAEAVADALPDLGVRAGVTCVAGAHENIAYALLTIDGETESGAFDGYVDMFTRLFAERGAGALSVGTSSCVFHSGDDLVRVLIDARLMADRHRRAATSESTVVPLPVPLAATLLGTEPGLAASLDAALLEPLADYDAQKKSSYLETLRTFFATDGNAAATASLLGIHINTLRYRLTRIERLTGRGLHTIADRADFYIALALRESFGPGEGDVPRPPRLR